MEKKALTVYRGPASLSDKDTGFSKLGEFDTWKETHSVRAPFFNRKTLDFGQTKYTTYVYDINGAFICSP